MDTFLEFKSREIFLHSNFIRIFFGKSGKKGNFAVPFFKNQSIFFRKSQNFWKCGRKSWKCRRFGWIFFRREKLLACGSLLLNTGELIAMILIVSKNACKAEHVFTNFPDSQGLLQIRIPWRYIQNRIYTPWKSVKKSIRRRRVLQKNSYHYKNWNTYQRHLSSLYVFLLFRGISMANLIKFNWWIQKISPFFYFDW